MSTAGHITSTPNADGSHRLKCPECETVFLSPITKNDDTGVIEDVICASCAHSEAPRAFLHEDSKKEANKIVMDYAEKELRKTLKKSSGNSKYIKFK